MQKAIGIVMVILAPTLMGFSKTLKLRSKARFLADLISALGMLRAEICTRLTPLPDVMEILSKSAPNSCRTFFAGLHKGLGRLGELSFAEVWEDEVRTLRGAVLSEEEYEAVNALGTTLGRYDSQEQKTSIDTMIARISLFTDEARAACEVQGKLWTGLGVAAGIMIAIAIV